MAMFIGTSCPVESAGWSEDDTHSTYSPQYSPVETSAPGIPPPGCNCGICAQCTPGLPLNAAANPNPNQQIAQYSLYVRVRSAFTWLSGYASRSTVTLKNSVTFYLSNWF